MGKGKLITSLVWPLIYLRPFTISQAILLKT